MANKARLSKTILDMKFMKKTKEKVEKEDADAEGRAMYANEITERMIHGSNFVIEPSYVYCENLISGRLSFRGMNPEIEKIMEQEEAAKNQKQIKQEQMEVDVNDNDMAEYYGNIVKTMRNKFDKINRKRKIPVSMQPLANKNMKYIKPKEEI